MIRLKEKAGASPLARPLQPPVPPGFVGAPPLVPASVPDRQQQQQLSVNGEVYFINVSSVGSSALIAKIANESPKFLGSFITFYQASVRGLVSYKPRNARYRLDGGAWVEVGPSGKTCVIFASERGCVSRRHVRCACVVVCLPPCLC